MYEKIMLIPLFTGLSHDQISHFLEKTSISFSQFKENEYICKKGDPVNTLVCILDGEISVQHELGENNVIIIEEIIDSPVSINSDRLFGIERSSSVTVKALRKTGIMEFKKKDFIKLLDTNEIFRLNYLNNLSYKAQSTESIFKNYPFKSTLDFINSLLRIFTTKSAKSVRLHFNVEELSAYTGLNIEEINTDLNSIINSPNIHKIPTGLEIINEIQSRFVHSENFK